MQRVSKFGAFGLGDLFVVFNTPNGDGRYTFTISSSAVPGPAAWALIIAGFGLAGDALVP